MAGPDRDLEGREAGGASSGCLYAEMKGFVQ